MSKINISFTWIGPPATQLKGHDTQGPDLFLQSFNSANFNNATHQLFFFCLKEFQEYYQQYFKGRPIQIVAVEDYLSTDQRHGAQTSGKIIELKQKISQFVQRLLVPERNTIRDRVTIKDLMHNFLCYSLGGYVLDTNIKPSQDFTSLPAQDGFYMVGLKGSAIPLKKTELDFFAYYSPVGHELPLVILEKQCEALAILEEKFQDYKSAEYYKALVTKLFRDIYHDWVTYDGKYWSTKEINGKTSLLPELNIIKEQENTHLFKFRKTYEREAELSSGLIALGLFKDKLPTVLKEKVLSYLDKELLYKQLHHGGALAHDDYHDAFYQIQLKNTEKLRQHIDNGLDITMRVTSKKYNVANETLLHFAVKYDNYQACELILSSPKGFKLLDCTAHYIENDGSKDSYTPLELAEILDKGSIVQLLKQSQAKSDGSRLAP